MGAPLGNFVEPILPVTLCAVFVTIVLGMGFLDPGQFCESITSHGCLSGQLL